MNALTKLLTEKKADFEILNHDKPIYTLSDASLYFDVAYAVPNLILNTDKGFYSLLISGSRGRADLDSLKEILHCSSVTLANKKQVMDQTGYKPGELPLIGLSIPYVFDRLLLQHPFVYGGLGNPLSTLKINPYDLKKLIQPIAEI
ncbi:MULTISPECIES: YbaK/EbsC family protein [unclassified Paenibacillus]|uniref:aminoacyl-tRNA deacylase n=1 Tax=unclassified Paenibacillus TaxID=185978 RepID=UPI00240641FB|nr:MULTISPECIES: YbaK/EbsC family protein [unclassified Paenibacillus]